MEHEVASHLVGTVGHALRVRGTGASQQQRRRVDGAARHDHHIAAEKLRFAAGDLRLHLLDLPPIRAWDQPQHVRLRDQRHVRLAMDRSHAVHVGIGLGIHHARIAVAGVAADARTVDHVLLVQLQADGNREGVVAQLAHAVEQFLDARLVADRGVRVRARTRRFGGIGAARAVHVEQRLGRGVVGLEVRVSKRPRRRHATLVLQHLEVALTQAEQRGAVHLGVAAHPVPGAGMQRLAVLVLPHLGGVVAVLQEHLRGAPVLLLARQESAALQDQDALAGLGQTMRDGAATRAGSDDDEVVVGGVHAGLIARGNRGSGRRPRRTWRRSCRQLRPMPGRPPGPRHRRACPGVPAESWTRAASSAAGCSAAPC